MKTPFLTKLFLNLRGQSYFLYSQSAGKRAIRRFINFRGRYRFEDRSQGRKHLAVIVAGFKERLWPIIFPRIARYVPEDYDVCVVCPGSHNRQLAAHCSKNGWSFLSTSGNQLSLAQNLAIRRHPKAQWIFKLDEDIVIPEFYFSAMKNAWAAIEQENRYSLGILAPLLNVNGYSSRIFLEARGRVDSFISLYGDARQSCMQTSCWNNPQAAAYLWELTRPFDVVAEEIARADFQYSACPHRFSIGAFLAPRDFWERLQGFSVAGPGELGFEESDLAAYCMENSQVIGCAHNILAGHVGFGPQTALMIPLLEKRDDLHLR